MISNNGLMTYKNKCFSFVNKGTMALLFIFLLIVIVPCSYLMFAFWPEMPIIIKILGPVLLLIILIGIVITLSNGMIINKSGSIYFIPDFRLKKLNMKDLIRISFVFNEWENNKYSVMIKFVYKDGNFFIKDYSKQFRNMKSKKIAMAMYTIDKRKVDKICLKLLDLDITIVTILDRNRNITYQNKQS